MSDSASVCSSHSATSVSLSKMECPYCSNELQVRGMFSHIRKFHSIELLKNTSRRWIAEAENGKPLRVYWTKKNDFDEDEETVLFVCMSTNKTFTTSFGCEQHFKKNKDALKDHNKQLKQLKKEFEAHKKTETRKKKEAIKQNPFRLRLDDAKASNDPELARAIWKGILNSKRVCELALYICKKSNYSVDTPMYRFDKRQQMFEQIPFSDFRVHHVKLMTKIETLQESKCMNVQLLDAVYVEALSFWSQNYQESIMGFHEDMKSLYPIYNYTPDEKFYNYAIEEMESVDF